MARRLPCVKTKVKYLTCDIDLFDNFADVEESIHGLSDSLYYQCSSIEVAEGKIKTWCRRKRKKGWRRLYDKD